MQADERTTSTSDDRALAMALAQAVRAVGRNLGADPRRVQAMVRDVLGSESRARRTEIDAVVLAAEAAVPEDLLAQRIDVGVAIDRLTDRGLSAEVSLFAVAVWRYALGLLADSAEPPTLTTSVSQPSGSAAATDTAPAPTGGITRTGSPTTTTTNPSATSSAVESSGPRSFDAISFQPTDVVASVLDPGAAVAAPGRVTPSQRADEPANPSRSAVRRWMPPLAIAVALTAAILFALVPGGSGEEDDASPTPPIPAASATPAPTAPPTLAPAPTTAPAPASAASTAPAATAATAPPTIVAPLPSAQFAVEQTDVGAATRTWAVDGQRLTGVVQISNLGDTPLTGWYYEVFPTSMVSSLGQLAPLDPSVPFVPFAGESVVRYLVEIPPRGNASVSYVVTLAAPPTQADLDTWKADQANAASAFREAAPTLAFDTATGGVVRAPAVELTGTAPGAARVIVNGREAEGLEVFDGSGRWWQPLTGLVAGVNAFEVVAISPYGRETRATWTVTYRPPTSTTNRTGSTGGGGGNGGAGAPTPQPTPTSNPVPPPP